MTTPTWPATKDFAIDVADGELAFVHDLMNTVSGGKPNRADLLADLDTAQAWLTTALGSLAALGENSHPDIELTSDDLDGLRALRADLRHIVTRAPDNGPGDDGAPLQSVSAALQLNSDGRVALQPRGNGARLVTSLVLSLVFRAQLSDTWRRLKACRSPKCAAVFYDRSRNNSGVWHDVHVCGNAANLRASRARRRGGPSDRLRG